MKPIWITVVFTQAESALLWLTASKTIKLSKSERALLARCRDLLNVLIGE